MYFLLPSTHNAIYQKLPVTSAGHYLLLTEEATC